MKRPSGIPDVAWYDVQRAWLARDAEHRAELDAARAANVMAAALIERLRGELGEALGHISNFTAIASKWPRTPEQRKIARESADQADAFLSAHAFLAAPPPAESTSIPCTASAGSCNSPAACGEAGRCIDARMREFVAPAPQPAPSGDEAKVREIARAEAESIATRWVPAHMTARQGMVDDITASLVRYRALGRDIARRGSEGK